MSRRKQEVVVNLFLSVYAPALILSVCRGLLLPVLPLFARSFEVSYSLVGVVLAADGIGTLLGDVPAGVVVRRVGEKARHAVRGGLRPSGDFRPAGGR